MIGVFMFHALEMLVSKFNFIALAVLWSLHHGHHYKNKQGYRYHSNRKAFSKFYHRHSELVVKYNIGLKTLLEQGILELVFYGDFYSYFFNFTMVSQASDSMTAQA